MRNEYIGQNQTWNLRVDPLVPLLIRPPKQIATKLEFVDLKSLNNQNK